MTELLCAFIIDEGQAKYFSTIHIFRSRKRRGSETLSEEEERSSGDESGAGGRHRRGRRSGQRLRKESRRRGEETGDKLGKLMGIRRSGSPVIMTECTAAMVLMDLSCSPANRGRMSHASGHSGRIQHFEGIVPCTNTDRRPACKFI